MAKSLNELAAQNPNAKVEGQVPPRFSNRCALRVLDAKFKLNSNKDPMITLNTEIIDPIETKVKVNDEVKTYALDTLKVPIYVTFSEKQAQNVKDLYGRLHLPLPEDIENPDTKCFENLVLSVILGSVEDSPKTQNPETGEFEPIKDEDGNPIVKWRMQVWPDNILGLSKIKAKEDRPY